MTTCTRVLTTKELFMWLQQLKQTESAGRYYGVLSVGEDWFLIDAGTDVLRLSSASELQQIVGSYTLQWGRENPSMTNNAESNSLQRYDTQTSETHLWHSGQGTKGLGLSFIFTRLRRILHRPLGGG